MFSNLLKVVVGFVSSIAIAVILKITAVAKFLSLDAAADWINGKIARMAPEMVDDLAPIIEWAVPLFVAAIVVAFTYKGFEWAHGFSGKSTKPVITPLPPRERQPKVSPDTGKHDVLLYDAIHYVATRSWDGERLDILSSNEGFVSGITQACEDVRQYACDGELIIWGRTGNSGPITLIDPNYWRAYGFEYFSLLRDAPEEFHTEIKEGQPRDSIYKRLKTSMSKIEELWPPANIGA